MPGPAGQHTLILQQERATKKVTGRPARTLASTAASSLLASVKPDKTAVSLGCQTLVG
jgi:hypothetical protein